MIKAIFIIMVAALAGWAAMHAILRRRDPRAALWWVVVTLAMPVLGAVLYYLFGINRIKRVHIYKSGHLGKLEEYPSVVPDFMLPSHPNLRRLANLVNRITHTPLTSGNEVSIYRTGDEAYGEMLKAIQGAKKSIGLDIYIFNDDQAGRPFVTALGEAVQRGVRVRVLMDEVGTRYSRTSAYNSLQKAGVRTEFFLPSLSPWRLQYLNLRNHRKLLTVDGEIGFTGGMNIHANHLAKNGPSLTQDLHFGLRGPVVAQMQEVIRDDWYFTTGENLIGPDWYPVPANCGDKIIRGVSDGPDNEIEEGRWIILGALDAAEKSIQIVTPYFIPDNVIISQLGLAALKGVRVDIVLPALNDLPFVHWASRATLWQVLEHGCHVWFSPPPFDHSKIMVVDQAWSLFGSSNWDTRSLRLNFEFNMECYDEPLAKDLTDSIQEKIASSHEVTLDEMDARRLPIKLRDGVARLFAPHL